MKTPTIFIIKLKEYFFTILITIFTICLVLFSTANIQAAKKGIELFFTGVFPSLFPFFIASDLLSHTNLIPLMSEKLNKYMKPIFNVPGLAAFPFIMGIISGYPTGAKIVTDFRNQNMLSKEEGERLLAFTNNSGPMFILGTVGTCMFLDKSIGLLLLITHILGTISVGLIFRFWKSSKLKRSSQETTSYLTFNNIGEVIGNSIKNSLNTVFMIGGFIILFSVIISILLQSNILSILPNDWLKGIIIGLVELTNGVSFVSSIISKNITINIVISAFLIGFGGISVLLQVFSITAKSDLSIKSYIYGKLLHGTLAAIYTYLLICIFPIFNFSLN